MTIKPQFARLCDLLDNLQSFDADEANALADELTMLAHEVRDSGGNHIQLYRLAELTVKHLGACGPALERARVDVANAERALLGCRDIGVAIGVLMTRRGVDREAAYDLLRRTSQESQVKIRDLAVEYLRTGRLPRTGGGHDLVAL